MAAEEARKFSDACTEFKVPKASRVSLQRWGTGA